MIFTEKVGMDRNLFQTECKRQIVTYWDRTYIVWVNTSDSSYMIKRIDSDNKWDKATVKWDMHNNGNFRIFGCLYKSPGQGKIDHPYRIVVHRENEGKLIFMDLSELGSPSK